ncbi:MAG TPA: fasciclin domain-containing protein [Kiritimatiellia bacterium]|nr:fasciclin domain-containing protein [Kiritimatiellia bacterium]HMP35721.1 fasciclin domain-containing protein [Kiritimatiellia bacterium]
MKKWLMSSLLAAAVSLGGLVPEAKAQRQTIVDVAIAANEATGEFSTLIAAVVAADLVDTLSGFRRYTVFAPTDAAFAALGLNAQNVGLAPKKELRNILLYHVTSGKRFSGSVLGARFLRMANGEFTRVSVNPNGAFINQSRLLAPDLIDIEASNGVIHVIDAVLVPSFLR